MIQNHSPWTKQLQKDRVCVSLDKNIETDVVIVGAGIAGITTAYFTLKNTNKNVVIIEADKVAHGATGHNAGHVTTYIEKSTKELVAEFGEKKAISGICLIESALDLIDQIYKDTGLKTPYYKLTGYGGYSTLEQIISVLEDNYYRLSNGLRTEKILIAEEAKIEKDIPEKYKDMYKVEKHDDILSLIETNNKSFIACSFCEEGCMNSALFCEELSEYMKKNFIDRFSLFENSPVSRVFLRENDGVVKTISHFITAEKIILCTNGFENFNIINEVGEEIDTKFHHSVSGRVGYMAGYLEPINKPPFAAGYFPKTSKYQDDPTGAAYLYMTRRPYEHEDKESYNLICGGGPEIVLPNHVIYSRDQYYSEEKKDEIKELFREHHKNFMDEEDVEYAFYWHGLMGYTPNGIRRVGFEPMNKVLLYNLGCNGIGITPSIYGAKRISQLLNNETLEESIFDPHDPRKI